MLTYLLCLPPRESEVIRTRILGTVLFVIFFTLSGCAFHSSRPTLVQPIESRAAYAMANEGLNYLNQGYTDRAQEKLQIALAQAPNDPLVLDAIGYYYEKTGYLLDANRYYLQAVKVAPRKYGTALTNYGSFLCRNGRYQESLLYFNKAIQTNYPYTYKAIANAAFCRQEMQRALGVKAT